MIVPSLSFSGGGQIKAKFDFLIRTFRRKRGTFTSIDCLNGAVACFVVVGSTLSVVV